MRTPAQSIKESSWRQLVGGQGVSLLVDSDQDQSNYQFVDNRIEEELLPNELFPIEPVAMALIKAYDCATSIWMEPLKS
ncbi:MAG: hypothetical protein R3C56_19610 [Pirellulaceae bacterium]